LSRQLAPVLLCRGPARRYSCPGTSPRAFPVGWYIAAAPRGLSPSFLGKVAPEANSPHYPFASILSGTAARSPRLRAAFRHGHLAGPFATPSREFASLFGPHLPWLGPRCPPTPSALWLLHCPLSCPPSIRPPSFIFCHSTWSRPPPFPHLRLVLSIHSIRASSGLYWLLAMASGFWFGGPLLRPPGPVKGLVTGFGALPKLAAVLVILQFSF